MSEGAKEPNKLPRNVVKPPPPPAPPSVSSPHPPPSPYYGGPPYGNPLLARINSLESRISELERTLANLLSSLRHECWIPSDDPHNKVRVEAQEVLRKRKCNDRNDRNDRGQGK